MFVLGFGMGMLFQTTQLVAQNSVALKDVGSATAAVMFVRSMGGSIGISMLGALYAHRLTDSVQNSLGAQNPLGDTGAQLSPELVKKLPQNVIGALQHGIVHGINTVMYVSAAIGIVGVLCAIFIKQVPLRGINSAPKPADAAAAPAAGGAPAGEPVAQAVAVSAGTDAGTGAAPVQSGLVPPLAPLPPHPVAPPPAMPIPVVPAAVGSAEPFTVPVVDSGVTAAPPAPVAAPLAALTVENAGPGLLVTAADGAPVPDARVTLLDRSGRQIEVGTADGTGAYLPSAAGAHAFAVVASAPGYAPHAGLVAPPNGVAQQVVLTPLRGVPLQPGQTVPVS
jgi:hypothetical protein